MKRIARLTFIVLIASMLVSCAQSIPTSTDTNAPIGPGDKIGDFLITTGEEGNVTYTWALDCAEPGDEEMTSCKSTVGTKVNVSVGIYDDTGSGKLNEYWSGHTYELLIEERPVNLQAFGFIDVNHPWVGKMRHWNVVIVASKPGEITIRDSGAVNGDPFKGTTIYTFGAP